MCKIKKAKKKSQDVHHVAVNVWIKYTKILKITFLKKSSIFPPKLKMTTLCCILKLLIYKGLCDVCMYVLLSIMVIKKGEKANIMCIVWLQTCR